VLVNQSKYYRRLGFTLIELVAAMTILAILTTVGIVGVRKHHKTAREAVLKEDIFQLNNCLNQYLADHGKYPTSIKNLEEQGYVRAIPVDPMTGSSSTWITELESPDPEDDSDKGVGIYRIRSGATETGDNGIPYSDW
jgi:general secretion pathway protein G